MKRIVVAALLIAGTAAWAQVSNPSIVVVASAPSGSCTQNLPDQQVVSLGTIYTCQSGTWALVGGGSGTFVTLSGDATSTATGGATTVVGIQGHAIAAPTSAGYAYWNGSAWGYQNPSSSGLSGMTPAQVPIAATASTITSSKILAGTGAGITTGPTSTTLNDCVKFGDTAGTLTDAGAACGSGGSSAPATVTCTYNASGTTSFPGASNSQAGCTVVTTHSTSTTFQPSGLVTWGTYMAAITQDSTGGGVTFTLGTTATAGYCYAWKITGGGSGAILLSTVANAQDELVFTYDGTNCRGTLLPNQN
jgi:hypothetical protein